MKATQRVRDEIYLSYNYIGDGETVSGEVCPVCEGGPTSETSLSVTKRGGTLLFNCHRSSCGLRGAVSSGGMPTFGEERTGLDRENSYPRIKTEPLNAAVIKFLATKFRIPAESFEYAGFGWTGDANGRYGRRVAMPIYGPGSTERGTSYRSYEGNSPKAIIELKNASEVSASWYRWQRKAKTLVLVEDQVSAVKLAEHTHSLALLGTHINEELADEIVNEKYERVVICLDNDATSKAIKLQLLWRHKIRGLCVHGLEFDIKDMTNEVFQKFLQQARLLPDPPVSTLELEFDDEIPF